MKTKYEPGVGKHIDAVCIEAVAFANDRGSPQTFDFNGITLTASPDGVPAELSAKYHDESEARNRAWVESPEGKKSRADREEQVRRYQATHDALMASLSDVLADRRDALMRWLSSYAEVADDIGVVKKLPEVVAVLEGAGYSANDATGLPKAEYQKPAIMCAYIVGQAISCMKNGMPPHPMTGSFVEQYFNLNR